MKKISFLILIFSLIGCTHMTSKPSATVSIDLYQKLNQYQGIEYYKACVLLGELVLGDNMLQAIRAETTATQALCPYYLLAKRTWKPNDVQQYIEKMPTGAAQLIYWKTHFDAGFPIRFTSPYIDLLALYAKKNQLALDKLISVLPYTDASFSQLLIDILAKLYHYKPAWVLNRLQAQHISTVQIAFIMQHAAYDNGKL